MERGRRGARTASGHRRGTTFFVEQRPSKIRLSYEKRGLLKRFGDGYERVTLRWEYQVGIISLTIFQVVAWGLTITDDSRKLRVTGLWISIPLLIDGILLTVFGKGLQSLLDAVFNVLYLFAGLFQVVHRIDPRIPSLAFLFPTRLPHSCKMLVRYSRRRLKILWIQLVCEILALIFFLTGFIIFWDTQVYGVQELTFIDGFYFAWITISTVGYGDVVPITVLSRISTIVFVIVLVILVPLRLSELNDLSHAMKQISLNNTVIGSPNVRSFLRKKVEKPPLVAIVGTLTMEEAQNILLLLLPSKRQRKEYKVKVPRILFLLDPSGSSSSNGDDNNNNDNDDIETSLSMTNDTEELRFAIQNTQQKIGSCSSIYGKLSYIIGDPTDKIVLLNSGIQEASNILIANGRRVLEPACDSAAKTLHEQLYLRDVLQGISTIRLINMLSLKERGVKVTCFCSTQTGAETLLSSGCTHTTNLLLARACMLANASLHRGYGMFVSVLLSSRYLRSLIRRQKLLKTLEKEFKTSQECLNKVLKEEMKQVRNNIDNIGILNSKSGWEKGNRKKIDFNNLNDDMNSIIDSMDVGLSREESSVDLTYHSDDESKASIAEEGEINIVNILNSWNKKEYKDLIYYVKGIKSEILTIRIKLIGRKGDLDERGHDGRRKYGPMLKDFCIWMYKRYRASVLSLSNEKGELIIPTPTRLLENNDKVLLFAQEYVPITIFIREQFEIDGKATENENTNSCTRRLNDLLNGGRSRSNRRELESRSNPYDPVFSVPLSPLRTGQLFESSSSSDVGSNVDVSNHNSDIKISSRKHHFILAGTCLYIQTVVQKLMDSNKTGDVTIFIISNSSFEKVKTLFPDVDIEGMTSEYHTTSSSKVVHIKGDPLDFESYIMAGVNKTDCCDGIIICNVSSNEGVENLAPNKVTECEKLYLCLNAIKMAYNFKFTQEHPYDGKFINYDRDISITYDKKDLSRMPRVIFISDVRTLDIDGLSMKTPLLSPLWMGGDMLLSSSFMWFLANESRGWSELMERKYIESIITNNGDGTFRTIEFLGDDKGHGGEEVYTVGDLQDLCYSGNILGDGVMYSLVGIIVNENNCTEKIIIRDKGGNETKEVIRKRENEYSCYSVDKLILLPGIDHLVKKGDLLLLSRVIGALE